MKKRGVITGVRKPLYFNSDNLARIQALFPDKPLSEIVNKSMSYILSQSDHWIREFIARQDISWLPKR